MPYSPESPVSSFSWRAHPAVHSGFQRSWQGGLKDSLISLITQGAPFSAEEAAQMRVRITGTDSAPAMPAYMYHCNAYAYALVCIAG